MDLVVPLQIKEMRLDHGEGKIKWDNTEATGLDIIPLGIVKHRIFWEPETRNAAPLCKSNDGDLGYPSTKLRNQASPTDEPPWQCHTCTFRSDGRRNSADRDEFKCTPEWTLLMTPIIPDYVYKLRLRGTSLWTFSKYAKMFERLQSPMFVSRMNVTVSRISRNDITYSELKVKRGDNTDVQHWPKYLDNFLEAQRILTLPPASAGPSGKNGLTPLSM